MKPSESSRLASRVMDAVSHSADPEGLGRALSDLLPRCTLSVSTRVPTAQIVRRGRAHAIVFGRDFLRDELADDRDLLFVLLHEVYHSALGHLFPRRHDPLARAFPGCANVAADMLVNRAVCARHFPDGVPFLSRYYGADIPVCLLKPAPCGGTDDATRRAFVRALTAIGTTTAIARMAWDVHCMAWRDAAPVDRLLPRVIDLMRASGIEFHVEHVLIGSHDPDGFPGGLDDLDWSECVLDGRPGSDDDLVEYALPIPPAVHDAALATVLRKALQTDPNRTVPDEPVPSVVPIPGRRDIARLASGHLPVLYRGNPVPRPSATARVYLDVSASMAASIGPIRGLLAALQDLVADPLYMFSNVVAACTLDDFARGLVRTTAATSFDIVLEHARTNRFRQIVVLTDGLCNVDAVVRDRFRATGASLHLVLVDPVAFTDKYCGLLPVARSCVVARMNPDR